MNVGSLFTGIGGFDLGLERAGMRVVWQCESDPFCRRVLAKHWPHVPCHEDVRKLRFRDDGAGGSGREWTWVGRVDVLCGGFPCQDLSYAGKGAGIDGDRSGLWSEYARLVGELRPRYVVVENVSALLARGLGRVLGDLAALGYDAEWDCVPASAVGAPHQRDRLWLVAYPALDGRGQGRAGRPLASGAGQPEPVRALQDSDAHGGRLEVGAQQHGQQGEGAADRHSRRRHTDGLRDEVADAASLGHERPGTAWQRGPGPTHGGGGGGADWWTTEPDVGRVAHGIPARVDRLRGLGNALVPQIAEWIGRRILEHEAQAMREAAA